MGFFLVMLLLFYAVPCVLSSFTITMLWKLKLAALLLLYFGCHNTVVVLCLFLMVLWVVFQFVIA